MSHIRTRRRSVPSTPVLGIAARKAFDRRGKSEDKEEREVCEILEENDSFSRLAVNTNKLYLWCSLNDVSVSKSDWKLLCSRYN